MQFQNPANPMVYEETTGPEILATFVSGVGTGGTVASVFKIFRAANPDGKIFAFETDEPAILSRKTPVHTRFKAFQLTLFLTFWIRPTMTALFRCHLRRPLRPFAQSVGQKVSW